jgi:hypothetical protein
MRTIIDIPDEQLAPLTQLCQQEDISRAEAIRQALTLYLEQRVGAVESAFGLWKDRGLDGVTHQRTLRAEWDE